MGILCDVMWGYYVTLCGSIMWLYVGVLCDFMWGYYVTLLQGEQRRTKMVSKSFSVTTEFSPVKSEGSLLPVPK